MEVKTSSSAFANAAAAIQKTQTAQPAQVPQTATPQNSNADTVSISDEARKLLAQSADSQVGIAGTGITPPKDGGATTLGTGITPPRDPEPKDPEPKEPGKD